MFASVKKFFQEKFGKKSADHSEVSAERKLGETAEHLPEHGPVDEQGREILLSVKNVDITFGKGDKAVKAVKNASFDIYKGETFSLVGESGSGKTTIGRAVIRVNPCAAGEIDYKQWVRHDFEALRRGGITREKIGDAVRGSHCTLAKNLTAAIGKLRSRGYVTAIISGGVDAVLRCLLNSPEALFDVVYINRLVWGEDGQLREIIPTEYDWDPAKKGVMGKCEGLRRICRDFGVTLEDSVFVGNDENDLMAMRIAGRKVCFSAQGEGLAKQVENVHFEPRNDLMLVADYVLGG